MIDDKLLQSFVSDIEWLRTFKSASAKDSASSSDPNDLAFAPFADMLAKAQSIMEDRQDQDELSDDLSAELMLLDALHRVRNDTLNTWVNKDKSKSSYLTSEDIDKLFPDLAALNAKLGPI